MRHLLRRVLPLTALAVAAFAISYAVAQAGQDDPAPRPAAVPGVSPETIGPDAEPRVVAFGAAAPLPALRARRRPAPAPAPAPVRAAPAPAPAPGPVAPAPAPVTPAPQPVAPAPAPAPQPEEPAGQRFRSER